MIEKVKDPNLSKLLEDIFNREDIKENFFNSAAGAEIHHAYTGGLAEHTLEVAKTIIHYCTMFTKINLDLTLTAGLLHDIGKVAELSCFPENKYTDTGRLIGHITLGIHIIEEEMQNQPNFPIELKYSLEHCILSHHGTLEMGSPVVPMTMEAVVLHNADQSSAEINGFLLAIQRDTRTGVWTDYNNVYKRFIKKG